MPIVTILPNGGKSYIPSPVSTHVRAPRGKAAGWTREVARRNTDFLLSVQADDLTGSGVALSLTIKDCPDTPNDWKALRERFVVRLRRMGMVRMHWLTEWQRRGVPHIHAAVWFQEAVDLGRVLNHWLEAGSDYRAGPYSQDLQPIHGTVGWFEYLAKHASRSITNYQRSPENIPTRWRGETGRMWGHLGDWPTAEPKDVELEWRPWWQHRRLMLRYQVAKARRQRDKSRRAYLTGYLKHARRGAMETTHGVAVPRFWIPEADQWELLALAMSTHAESD